MSGKYIVVFKKSASQSEIDKYVEEVGSSGGKVSNVYSSSSPLKGFSAEIPSDFVGKLQSLTGDGPIDYIEEDSVVRTQ